MLIGDIEVTYLCDGELDVTSDHFPPLIDAEPDERRPVTLGLNAWVVRAGGRLVLVDAGGGNALRGVHPRTGHLLRSMKRFGIDPKAIDDIVITHMHPDHIGGLVAEGSPAFPDTPIHIARAEWDFWHGAEATAGRDGAALARVEFVRRLARVFEDNVVFVEKPAELGDGITIEPLPGHTPGHSVVHLASGSKQFCLLGDAIISPEFQIATPERTYALDIDPALAAENRLWLFDRISFDDIPFATTHFAYPGAGCIQRRDNTFTFEYLKNQVYDAPASTG